MTIRQHTNSRVFFFFNDTATTEIYTLSLHDALPISRQHRKPLPETGRGWGGIALPLLFVFVFVALIRRLGLLRSEEHTSELQSRQYLVCRLLLEKKKMPRCRSLTSSLQSLFLDSTLS